ncbi:n-acetyltransferase b complex non catalytic subunit [Cystoisospora suis]|uniref:N-acetyltransferase b complex non catalytic subunit n=1 Tax=Cystoisospora suis TaxID=483139 RepID=A0A2C6KGX4_9APIC|nr:n-acetyltransferase b complex non catalytic subunit [Cystoisospora suis]
MIMKQEHVYTSKSYFLPCTEETLGKAVGELRMMDGASSKARDQIRASIDAGEYKEAIRLASQHLIRKGGSRNNETASLFKALRTVALTRCGQEDDAVTAARELERVEDKSLEATRLVSVAFKELREVYYLPPTRASARQFLPLSEAEDACAFLDSLASSSLRFDKLQQGAWKLFSKFKRPKYLEWVLVCILLQGIGPTSEATWSLAQKLLAKLPPIGGLPQVARSPPDVMRTPVGCCQRRDAYARFILEFSVLRQSSQYPEALELLDQQKGISLVALEELSLRLQILLEAGRLREAFEISKQLLECAPLNVRNYENCIRIALACEDTGEGRTLLKDLEARWRAAFHTSFEAAYALLALHRLAVVRPLSDACHQVWTDDCLEEMWPDGARGELVKCIVEFVQAHGHDSRTFFTLRGLLGCLPASLQSCCATSLQELRGTWHSLFQERLEAAETKTKDAEKREETNPSGLAASSVTAELDTALKNVVSGRDRSAADELLLLAADVLLYLDFESCRSEAGAFAQRSQATSTDPLLRRRFYFIALTLLSQAVSSQDASGPGVSPPAAAPGHRAVLQWLTASVGLLTTSKELFSSLDIKNAMLASLGYSLLFPLSDYGFSGDVVKIGKQIQNLSEDTINSTTDGLCACLEEGSYTAIADCLLSRNAVCASLLTSVAELEGCIHQSCGEGMDFQRSILAIACTAKLQQISFPLLSAARISAREAVLPGFSIDTTWLALAGEDRLAGRVAATGMDCRSVVCNLTTSPPESARLLLHLADPVQRSLTVYAALKNGEQGAQRRPRREVVAEVEAEIQRAVAGTQE